MWKVEGGSQLAHIGNQICLYAGGLRTLHRICRVLREVNGRVVQAVEPKFCAKAEQLQKPSYTIAASRLTEHRSVPGKALLAYSRSFQLAFTYRTFVHSTTMGSRRSIRDLGMLLISLPSGTAHRSAPGRRLCGDVPVAEDNQALSPVIRPGDNPDRPL